MPESGAVLVAESCARIELDGRDLFRQRRERAYHRLRARSGAIPGRETAELVTPFASFAPLRLCGNRRLKEEVNLAQRRRRLILKDHQCRAKFILPLRGDSGIGVKRTG